MAKKKLESFNLAAAFEKARQRMQNPERRRCKHRHPISAANACVADLKRTGLYFCSPCIALYARNRAKAGK